MGNEPVRRLRTPADANPNTLPQDREPGSGWMGAWMVILLIAITLGGAAAVYGIFGDRGFVGDQPPATTTGSQ